MANPDFPSITKAPYSFDIGRVDNVLRSDKEGGYEQTRPRNTRIRRELSVKYRGLTAADKSTIDTFFDTTLAGGSAIFTFTDPTGASYSVRLKEPHKWSLTLKTATNEIWGLELEIREV